ncbi:hypothetical protein B0A80_19385 [Flavobacterium tructae]|uniref:hypothetical protein n=1 Tax=Flavobacterium tructae TaxID=1114873 RepID=UPI000B5BFC21|nr:hypothetical protein [Flavobacterium tructae]OXB20037.1 hypothetical protein B0A80_19385 [Flavobacterium tructae]
MTISDLENQPDAKSFVQRKLFPIIVIVEIIAIILSFSDSLVKLNLVINQNYYYVIFLIWVSSSIFLFYSTFKRKQYKIILFVIVTIIFITAICYKYWEVNLRKTNQAKNPNTELTLLFLGFFSTSAYAASPPPTTTFKIEEFYLNDQLCSFTDTKQFKFGLGPKEYRTFSYNQDVNVAFKKGNCTGLDGNKPLGKVLPLLQKRLDAVNRNDLKQYIKTVNDLSRIIATRGDIFEQIMFTDQDIIKMKKNDPENYSIVRDWLVKCIGVKSPVVSFVLRNLKKKDIIISKVEYEILEVGQVLGGEGGPLYPIITYNYILRHSIGKQVQVLNPPFKLASNALDSFNIRLIPASKTPGQAWILKIKIYDTEGNSQVTDVFQIIMSK